MFAIVSALLLSQAPGIQAWRLFGQGASTLPHNRRLSDAYVEEDECKSPLDILSTYDDLSTFTTVLAASPNVQGKLGDADGAFTVLAPTNDAIAYIPEEDLDELLAVEPALDSILGLHVLPGTVKLEDLTDGEEVETLDGMKLTVTKKGDEVTFTAPDDGSPAMVVGGGIRICDNMVHKIDGVLIPGAPGVTMEDADAPATAPEEATEEPEEEASEPVEVSEEPEEVAEAVAPAPADYEDDEDDEGPPPSTTGLPDVLHCVGDGDDDWSGEGCDACAWAGEGKIEGCADGYTNVSLRRGCEASTVTYCQAEEKSFNARLCCPE